MSHRNLTCGPACVTEATASRKCNRRESLLRKATAVAAGESTVLDLCDCAILEVPLSVATVGAIEHLVLANNRIDFGKTTGEVETGGRTNDGKGNLSDENNAKSNKAHWETRKPTKSTSKTTM